MGKPEFIYRDGMLPDKDYVSWVSEVKERFRRSQMKAAVRVNSAMLEFYWSVGRDLERMKAEQKWGSGVVKQFALDMRETFPGEKGFSYSNVKDMKRWYLFYYKMVTEGQQLADLLPAEKSQQVAGQIASLTASQRGGDILEMPEEFGAVPWGQHIQIVSKSETLAEVLYYVKKVAEEGISRSRLEDMMASKLYQREGSAITNFSSALSSEESRIANELLKSEYDLSFITAKEVEEERDLEEALTRNVTRFLLELGRGFAYVGRQMELRMDEESSFFPDLVFYHIPQRRYVIVELKAVKFMPEFAGKLNFYVTAADKLLRGEGDNKSIGLLICKTAKKTIVEWSFEGIDKPLGVATYQLQEVVERTIAEIENVKEGNRAEKRQERALSLTREGVSGSIAEESESTATFAKAIDVESHGGTPISTPISTPNDSLSALERSEDLEAESSKGSSKTVEMILELLKANPNMTVNELARETHTIDRNIKKHLKNLQEAGRLRRIGSNRSGQWEVITEEER